MTLNESPSIAVRRFGSTDLYVSEFGLGCARIGGIFKREPAEFINLLSAAYDVGITFFDTANIYSQGESEELIGRAFRTRRERVVIATKAGFVLPARRQVVARLKPIVRPMLKAFGISRQHLPSAVRGAVSQDFSPAGLREAVEGSLRRLRTDHLDLLQLHAPAPEVVESGEWVDALEALKREGKIRYYGASCESPEASLAALKHPGVSSIQVAINLLYREELAAIRSAAANGVAVIGRESLANGLLVKDLPREHVRRYVDSDEEAERKADAIERWRDVAGRYGLTLAQLALSYVNGLDGIGVTLVGVSRLTQLDAIAAAGLPPRTAVQNDRSPFTE
jgi:aryl-alcohol dehydrogenase-like predicted oxidoreductase